MGFDLVRQPLLWYNRLNEVVYLNFRREINTTILYNFGDFPFAAIGVIVGAVGLYMVFSDMAE